MRAFCSAERASSRTLGAGESEGRDTLESSTVRWVVVPWLTSGVPGKAVSALQRPVRALGHMWDSFLVLFEILLVRISNWDGFL